LHIMIVQHKHDIVKWLLDRGASVDDRALGIFFQEEYLRSFDKDTTLWSVRQRKYQLQTNEFYSECDFGEYPLSFAAAVGDEKLCHLLLDSYSRRLDRMILLAERERERERDLLGTISVTGDLHRQDVSPQQQVVEIEGQWCFLKSGSHMPGEGLVSIDLDGGQLFTKKEIRHFVRQRDEWLNKMYDVAKRTSGQQDVAKRSNAEHKAMMLEEFVNRQDSAGNTALHTAVSQASKHDSTLVLTWLWENKAQDSLSTLNKYNLTPITLAARRGNVDVLASTMEQQKITVWKYGAVALTLTNLEQIDTYKIENHLHQNPKWLSALQLVVRHEIAAFHDEQQDNIFEWLVREKWTAFGANYHFIFKICPHLGLVVANMCLLVARVSGIYWRRHGEPFPMDTHDHRRHEIEDRMSEEQVNTLQLWYCPVVLGISIPVLLWHAYKDKRLKYTDLDVNEDQTITFVELLRAVYRNLSSLLNIACALAMLVQACAWHQTRDLAKVNTLDEQELEQSKNAWLLEGG